MRQLSKRAQPTVDLKKQEINKLVQNTINKATQMLVQTNLSNDQKIQQLTTLFSQMLPSIEDKVNEAVGNRTVTVSPNDQKQQAADDKKSSDILSGGIGDDVSYDDLNKEQLEIGTEVELEHTNNKDLAREIAKDHLSEQFKDGKNKDEQDYYTELEKIDPHYADDNKIPAFWKKNLDYGEK